MKRISKVAALTAVSIVAVYFGFTWFYFGSPHPCTMAARVIEWEAEGQSEEQWLEFARALAMYNVSRSKLEQSQKNKLAAELEFAPREVVQRYLEPDFTPDTIARDTIEKTKVDTPANCVQILYGRMKQRLPKSRADKKKGRA